MKLLELKSTIIYGPVSSRRLGASLGINVTPGRKVCSFDCIYCQYGRTQVHTLYPENTYFPTVEEVGEALRVGIQKHPESKYVTFSGNGEPTLHPDFGELVDAVIELRDELLPSALTAVLSNGSTLQFPRVLEAVNKLDVPIIKIDAGNAGLFQKINRPCEGATFEKLVDGATSLSGMKSQSVLFEGPLQNHTGIPLDDWIGIVAKVKPLEAQIYSTQRPVPDMNVKAVSPARLDEIADRTRRESGVEVNAYY